MEELSNYSPTELLKLINDSKTKHESLKKEIIDDTFKVDELEKTINEKLNDLTVIEQNYVKLIEELNNR
jgi:membrane-bound ClpP family serine protease